ncbi:THAP domain-containing protein 4-like isoform X2 [Thrips palmi]|nr:THAP domain-containing protein 4-like isoform X2 [Thrips palmi]
MTSLPEVLQGKPVNDSLKPILWIVGTWEATAGKGSFPTINPFTYCERIQFSSFGQPFLNYSSHSWHPEKKVAMHMETGYLRIKPGTDQVAFMVAHNFGLTSLEEGNISGNQVSLKSTQISRMSWAKEPEVTKLERTWSLNDDGTLEQVVFMETKTSSL